MSKPTVRPLLVRHALFNEAAVPLIGSLAMCTLVVLRILMTGEQKYLYLFWNVNLAWIAWMFGVLLVYAVNRKMTLWHRGLLGAAWLFFLPNTFYLLTDMIHPVVGYEKIPGFHGSDFSTVPDGVMILFDVSLVGLAVWVGWYLGVKSLLNVWPLLWRRLGLIYATLTMQCTITASAYAIYLGRSPRLNSWDIIFRPLTVVKTAIDPLLRPVEFVDAWALTTLFAFLISVAVWSHVIVSKSSVNH